MTWTAPHPARTEPPSVADERTALDAWLDYHRATLLLKCAGLTAEQLRRRSVPPSNLSLLGLVRHMSEVERSWFRRRVAGEDVTWIYCTDESPDADFDDVGVADPATDLAVHEAELAAARAAVRQRGLDDTFHHAHHGVDLDVRWVYIHMIEEYARHNGHADLLREAVDGATGE
jgi:hypothetical protein